MTDLAAADTADAASTDATLAALPDGAKVALVTLLGSLCPFTLGHLQAFVEARRVLLDAAGQTAPRPRELETYAEVVGIVCLNPDRYVDQKMDKLGQKRVPMSERRRFVELSLEGHAHWLSLEVR